MKNQEEYKQPENKNLELTDEQRRDFVKKYGKLAAITPVAMAALMSDVRAQGFSDSAGF